MSSQTSKLDTATKQKLFQQYSLIFWIFFLGSLYGFFYENGLMFLKGELVLTRGLIHLPLIPVYGLGITTFYLAYGRIDFEKKDRLLHIAQVFVVGLILGGAIEYLCSFIQEKLFGTISWDYSSYKFNIEGRTSLFHAFFWGVFGVLFNELLFPFYNKIKIFFNKHWFKVLTVILSCVLLLDCTISLLACYRQIERKNHAAPDNALEQFLDKYYPDHVLEKVYSNAVRVNEPHKPNKK